MLFPPNQDLSSSSPLCSLDEETTLCNTSSRNILSSQHDILFAYCEWRDITLTNAEEGGAAIQFHSSSQGSKIVISHCLFDSLSSMKGYGGAVDIQDAYDASVLSSSFSSCNRMDSEEGGGGGVSLLRITHQPLIQECSFFSCFSQDCGGMADIHECEHTENPVCSDIVSIQCTVEDDSAGGIIIEVYGNMLPFSNCLFSNLIAVCGGAVYLYLPEFTENQFPVRFCFFTQNTANFGNDVFTYPPVSSTPFFHCYSTTEQERLGYWDHYGAHLYLEDFDNWIPNNENSYILCLFYQLRRNVDSNPGRVILEMINCI